MKKVKNINEVRSKVNEYLQVIEREERYESFSFECKNSIKKLKQIIDIFEIKFSYDDFWILAFAYAFTTDLHKKNCLKNLFKKALEDNKNKLCSIEVMVSYSHLGEIKNAKKVAKNIDPVLLEAYLGIGNFFKDKI